VTVHRKNFLIINQLDKLILKFILKKNFTCFGSFSVHHQEFFYCTHSNGILHTGLLTAFKQDQEELEFHPDLVVCTVKNS
jgi:hypothetical protein